MSKRRKGKQAAQAGKRRRPELEAQMRQAFELHQQGLVERAATIYEQVLREDPTDADALNLLGVSWLHRNDPGKAIPHLESACEVSPRDADFRNNLGSAYRDTGDIEGAIAQFQRATKLRSDFSLAYFNLGASLGMLERHEEAVPALSRGISLDGTSADAYSNLGICLQALGDLDGAIEALDKALILDPKHSQANENMGVALELEDGQRAARRSRILSRYLAAAGRGGAGERQPAELGPLFGGLVPRWHFPMLNDTARNEAYERALRARIGPDDIVLDIGTGSGLLAMMAARAGARHVYACEMVEPLAAQARRIIADNGLGDRITVIGKASTELEVGTDLPERASFLVTETVDVGLLGEGTVPTLNHARQHLITPAAAILPAGARVHAALVESTALRELDEVGQVSGFDLSGFNVFSLSPRYLQVALTQHAHTLRSEVVDVFDFDFTRSMEAERESRLEIRVEGSGRVDALAFWFSLFLDGENTVSSAPGLAESHWQQAVILSPQAIPVVDGQSVAVRARHDETRIQFEFA